MQAVSIIGLTRDIDNVISVLGESGVFHPDDVSSFYSNTKDFTHLQSKNIYAEPLNTLKATLSLTKRKFNLVDVSDFNPTFKEIELFTNQINSDIEVLADDRLFVEEQLMQAKENLVETLTNTLKHSGADEFSLKISVMNKVIRAEFKDNGKGSDSFRKGTGLTAIEERTVLTDGKCIFPAQTDGFSVVNIFSLKEENV